MAKTITKNILGGIVLIAVMMVLVVSLGKLACAQSSACVLKSYSTSTTLSATASQGQNGQFPQTGEQIKAAANTALTEVVASQYGKDVVECDLKCRGQVTSATQSTPCISKGHFITTPTSYAPKNTQATQWTASTTYTFICECKDQQGGN
jgi:hypothetical protein